MYDNQPWWKTLLGGILLLITSLVIYNLLRNVEQAGDQSRRILAPIAVLYQWGGIWGATLPFAGLGSIMLFLAAYDFFSQAKKKTSEMENGDGRQ